MPGVMVWDVTVQQDFIPPKGKLPVPGAAEAIPRIASLLARARRRGVQRMSIACEHRLEDACIALRGWNMTTTFPPHCLRGTPGAGQAPEVRQVLAGIPPPSRSRGPVPSRADSEGGLHVLVRGFDPFSEPEAERLLDAADPSAVVICGFPLELSVRASVTGLLARGRTVRLVREAVAALQAEAGAKLLDEWRAAGVEIHDRAPDGDDEGPAAAPIWRQ